MMSLSGFFMTVDPRFFPFHPHCYFISRGNAVSLRSKKKRKVILI